MSRKLYKLWRSCEKTGLDLLLADVLVVSEEAPTPTTIIQIIRDHSGLTPEKWEKLNPLFLRNCLKHTHRLHFHLFQMFRLLWLLQL